MNGDNNILFDTIIEDSETLYCHCDKHHAPRLAKEALEKLR